MTWSSFNQISNLIDSSIKLPNETPNNPLSVVIVDVEFGGISPHSSIDYKLDCCRGVGIYHAQHFFRCTGFKLHVRRKARIRNELETKLEYCFLNDLLGYPALDCSFEIADARLPADLTEAKPEAQRLKDRMPVGTPTINKALSLNTLFPKWTG